MASWVDTILINIELDWLLGKSEENTRRRSEIAGLVDVFIWGTNEELMHFSLSLSLSIYTFSSILIAAFMNQESAQPRLTKSLFYSTSSESSLLRSLGSAMTPWPQPARDVLLRTDDILLYNQSTKWKLETAGCLQATQPHPKEVSLMLWVAF